jgi:hypothetical protein
MNRSLGLILAVIAAGGLATASSARSTERSGELHVTKTCSEYTGAAGSFCTIRSSNVDAIKPGMKVVYQQASSADGSLNSDIVLTPRFGNLIFGHVVLNATTSEVTLSGGTGKLRSFHASAVVSVDETGLWHWDGSYSFR